MSTDVSWPAEAVERRALSSLVPYARNARVHSDAQVAQLAASIREWGWTVPVLCDERGGIIAGHGRVLAAQRLGIAEAPVVVARGWSDAKKRAYVIADNKLALNADWDRELLSLELGELRGGGVELSSLGFEDREVKSLLADADGLSPASKLADGLMYQVIVECETEEEQFEVLEALKAAGRRCRPLTL